MILRYISPKITKLMAHDLNNWLSLVDLWLVTETFNRNVYVRLSGRHNICM